MTRRISAHLAASPILRHSKYVLLELAIAYVISNINQMVINRFSAAAVAAQGSAAQVATFVLNLYTLLSVGASILLMRYADDAHKDDCQRVCTVSVLDVLVVGVGLSAAGYALCPLILRLMQIPQALYPHAYSYLAVMLGFSFVGGLLTLVSAIYRAYGAMRVMLVVDTGINLLCMALNILVLYVVPPEKQSLGLYAANGVIAQAIGCVLLLRFLHKTTGWKFLFRLAPSHALRQIHIDTGRILRYGVMGGAEGLIYLAGQTVVVAIVGLLGEREMLVRAYVLNITPYLMLCDTAITTAAFYVVGKRAGAGDPDGARAACRQSVGHAIIATAVVGGVFLLLAEPILRLYTQDAAILLDCKRLLCICTLSEILRCPASLFVSSLKAVGRVDAPFAVILPGMALNVACSWICGIWLGWGLIGIWVGYMLDHLFRGVTLGIVWQRWTPDVAH